MPLIETLTATDNVIREGMGAVLRSGTVGEASGRFEDIVEHIDLTDIHDELRTKLEAPSEVVDDLMQSPYKSVMRETSLLQAIYTGRTLPIADSLNQGTEFITRSADGSEIDTIYRNLTSHEGRGLVTIQSHLRGQLGRYCTFAAANGKLRVFEDEYRGYWKSVERPLGDNSRGDILTVGILTSTVLARYLALTRHSEETPEIDARALKMLEQDREARPGRLAVQRLFTRLVQY